MSSSNQETRKLAAYIKDMNYDHFDEHTIDITKMCILDFMGVAIAGSAKKESSIWTEYYAEKVTAPLASLFQRGFQNMTAAQAAALNAVFGHVMDMDDVHNASITHLAVITVPTAFALAQKLHLSGKQLIEAVAAGYEAGARIVEPINPSSYKYWHTTAVVGAFSSGATASKLLGLTEEQIVNCFGSAGTQAAGLWEFLASGSMSKVLHTANANLCGMRAAELAKLGFTGAPTILEGERAFVNALAPEHDMNNLVKGFGEGYRITENSFKPYACCRHTHSADYCVEQILAAHDRNPDPIVSLTDDPDRPGGHRVFTIENINNPNIKELMSKIKVNVSPKLDDEFHQDPNQWSHKLTITMKNGEVITDQVDYPIGDFKNPFDWAMADRKFRLLTEDMLAADVVTRLLDNLHNLETFDDINKVFQLS